MVTGLLLPPLGLSHYSTRQYHTSVLIWQPMYRIWWSSWCGRMMLTNIEWTRHCLCFTWKRLEILTIADIRLDDCIMLLSNKYFISTMGKTLADLLIVIFIPFSPTLDIEFIGRNVLCGYEVPIKIAASIVSMMMCTFMAIDRCHVSFESLNSAFITD